MIRIFLGPFALYWLHNQTADFKAKYIRSMINIAAPWGGAIKALRLMISGDNIDVRLIYLRGEKSRNRNHELISVVID